MSFRGEPEKSTPRCHPEDERRGISVWGRDPSQARDDMSSSEIPRSARDDMSSSEIPRSARDDMSSSEIPRSARDDKTTLRIAQIGRGHGHALAKWTALRASPDVEAVGLFDSVDEAGEALAAPTVVPPPL